MRLLLHSNTAKKYTPQNITAKELLLHSNTTKKYPPQNITAKELLPHSNTAKKYPPQNIAAKKLFFLIVILLITSFHGFSQEDTTAVQDSVPVHSVRKATILSAALPGAGQIYNHIAMPKGKKKAFWKVPLIYGGLGALGFFVVDNHRTVLELRDQYNLINGGGSATGIWSVYGTDKTAILAQHDQFARWRDFSIIGFVAVYAVQVIDAAVEAHFVNFDVSEDLSMRISPTVMNQQSIGLKLSLNFR